MYRMYGMSWAHGCAGATISRLVALVPKPKVNLTRFYGVFAPNSKCRARVTPAGRGKRKKSHSADEADIQKILAHLDDRATSVATALLPDCRASPPAGLFD